MRTAFIIALLLLAGCATTPRHTRDACAVFEQRDGLFDNWERAARKTEREFGVPVSVLMATIYTESGFRAKARPRRTKLLGFIPWKRLSTAYGYSQALDGTWDHYKKSTGRWGARRTKFADAVHFVGWYHFNSHLKNGIALNDAYNLYLAYYSGDAGYRKGKWRSNGPIKQAAQRSANLARTYAQQLRSCD
ncbi:transglycosylase SLT domain-containing protein [Pararhizobium antarcticum]|uniref:Transglycosylase SLT domain-containing protein n=1 Tax=Pararhizobium antarcticum TaxID=1798805 RepID=A0A657LQC9_9HYPH|nr:transglycosylase SLT domain-containing protein [Pararhizobium antarcticum]OJF91793.1 hypothetical protein AX761_21840 [Rhizobium sp. 58]OJF93731.1 hypothetical protein AX760_21440 [Pararhizobium antarcticum]